MIKARPIAQEVYSCLEWVWARLLLLAEARSRNISSDICAVTAPPSCDGTVGIQVNFIWVPRNCESLVNKMVTSNSATQTFFEIFTFNIVLFNECVLPVVCSAMNTKTVQVIEN